MCGRFVRTASAADLADLFQLTEVPPLEARYNIAPSQAVLAVRQTPDHPARELVALRWGLIPHWADDPKIGYRLINARAETAADKPAFRSAFRSRRCLVAATGFYEWQKRAGDKQPFYIRRKDATPLAFAGLWELWHGPEGQALETCTILTTEANEVVRPIHDRMPVILGPGDFDRWLDPEQKDPAKVQGLLGPYPAETMLAYPVSPLVNDPRHEDPRCLEPQAEAPPEPPQPRGPRRKGK
jgi:putative SOS response-associated peptidase YedK